MFFIPYKKCPRCIKLDVKETFVGGREIEKKSVDFNDAFGFRGPSWLLQQTRERQGSQR